VPELYDERRQEPRFRTAGEASFRWADRDWQVEVLDLSLNGLKIDRPAGLDVERHQRFTVVLAIPQFGAFSAEVMLVHAEGAQLGLEFYDMPPRDFGVLAGLIEAFQRLRKQQAL
jgi:PilZ domain